MYSFPNKITTNEKYRSEHGADVTEDGNVILWKEDSADDKEHGCQKVGQWEVENGMNLERNKIINKHWAYIKYKWKGENERAYYTRGVSSHTHDSNRRLPLYLSNNWFNNYVSNSALFFNDCGKIGSLPITNLSFADISSNKNHEDNGASADNTAMNINKYNVYMLS